MRAMIVRGAALAVAAALTAGVGVAQESDSNAAAALETEAFVKAAIDFTAGVRLDAKSVGEILANLESLNALKDEKEGQDLFDRAVNNGHVDFGVVLKDPEFVGWCAKHKLDTAGFFKSLMRLELLMMREDVKAGDVELQKNLPEQRKQIEDLRATMGEESYKQSVEALESSVATFKRMVKLVEQVPAANTAEQALLAKYGPQLRAAMGEEPEDIQP